MRLFLVRHGESVDNVAGVFAGSRDSPLTSHGVLQARCTAARLAKDAALQFVYSSDLRRAVKSAEAIVEEQRRVHQFDGGLVQLASLREKDYGSLEGVRYDGSARRRTVDDAETRRSMTIRLGEFLDQHLVPLLDMENPLQPCTCAIVAHGTILSVLFSLMMDRVRKSPMDITTLQSLDDGRQTTSWWNAGVTECALSSLAAVHVPSSAQRSWGFRVTRQNSTSHLRHLKKTRGGIGSAAHDDRQKTLTSFFAPMAKRRRYEDGSL